MCFTTEIADPTQQPIRIVQTHEAHDSEESGDVSKVHKTRTKSGSGQHWASEHHHHGHKDGERAMSWENKSTNGSVEGGAAPKKKARALSQAELKELYRQQHNHRTPSHGGSFQSAGLF